MAGTEAPRSRRPRVGARIAFALLVVLIAAFAAAFLIAPFLQSQNLTAQARQEAADGIAAQRPLVAGDVEAVRAALAEPFGEPAQADEVVECRVVPTGPIWAPGGHTHTCTVTARLLYPVPGSREDTNLALAAIEDRLGPAEPSDAVCSTLRQASPSAGVANSARIYNSGSDADPGCPLPPPTEPKAAVRVAGSIDPATIDRSVGWLLVSLRREASATELGCRFPTALLCESPVEEPQLP